MKRQNNETSTGSSSQIPEKSSINKILEWSAIWWPLILLSAVLIGAGVSKYIWPLPKLYGLMIEMTKAISLLMLVIYVIYTRLLAVETKKMAEASVGMFFTEKGRVASEVNETTCTFESLCECAKNVSNDIHIKEKKIPRNEYEEFIKAKDIPAISLLIKNLSPRSIDADKIEYSVRHTGSDHRHNLIIKVDKDGTIKPWEDKVYNLIVAPEGEIELVVNSLTYIDNRGIVNKIDVEKSFTIDRIRKPENKSNG